MRMQNLTLAASFLLLGCLFSSAGRADETPDPCAAESKQARASIGKPQFEEAEQAWQDCQTKASEQKKKEFAETRYSWARGLDQLPNGGWELLEVSPDGTNAVFGSRRHETRKGSAVAVWLRFEYRETQSNNGATYKGTVERVLYDCGRMTSQLVSMAYYGENNLGQPGASYTHEESKDGWIPVIPGTVGEVLLEWACKAPRAQPAKAQ